MADSAREQYLKRLAATLLTISSEDELQEWLKAHPNETVTYDELLEGRSLLEKEHEATPSIPNENKKEQKDENKHQKFHTPPSLEEETSKEEKTPEVEEVKEVDPTPAQPNELTKEKTIKSTISKKEKEQFATDLSYVNSLKTDEERTEWYLNPDSVKQPTVLHSHRKVAEKALIHDWGEKYKATEREITEARRKQLVEKFQQELEKHNAQAKNDFEKRDSSWVRKQVNEALYYFSRGADVTRGQIDPSGKPIRTEIDTLTDALFKKKYGRDWHPSYEIQDANGRKLLVPASPSFSLQEIEDKARQLYPNLYTKKSKKETIVSRTIPYVPPVTSIPSPPAENEEILEVTDVPETPFPFISGGEEMVNENQEIQDGDNPSQHPPFSPPPIPPDQGNTQENSSQPASNMPSARQIRQGQRIGSRLGQEAGKKLATRVGTQAALSGAGSLAGTAAGGVGGAAAGAGGSAAVAGAGAGLPVIAIILAIVFVIILIIILLVVILGGGAASQIDSSLIPVSLTKTADKTEVPNPINSDLTQPDPSDVTYTLNVSYPGRAQDVVVTDPIPQNSTFVKATGIHDLVKDASGRVLSVSWSLKANQSASVATTPTGATPGNSASFDITKYTQPPYSLPAPNGDSNIVYTNQIMDNLNELGGAVATYQPYLTSKFDAKYVDPFLAVIWTGAIEGSYGNPYSWNCQDLESGNTINNGCAGGFYSGGWQVAGIQVAQAANHMVDDFKAVYGVISADDAEKVQEIGQAVITNSAQSSAGQITNPSTFPHKTLPQLVSEAQSGDIASQQALAILLMDRQLGAVVVSLEVAGDISSRDNWRATMEGWGSWYASNMQSFSNRMQAIAKLYTGTGTVGGGSTFASRTFTLTVRPTQSDTYLVNRATARVVGAETGDGDSPGGNTGTVTGDIAKLLPDPLPADPANATEIKASILAHFQTEKDTLIPLYKEASTKSGIPWQVFAGIHWREGDALPGYSLTSGRPIGGYEPDRAASGDCTGPVGAVDGKADINCAFADGVDDILFVANHLKGKIGKTPATFEELVTALSRYNGTGNVNCYQTPYTFCPPLFDGEDSPYALNFFDDRHSQMYLRYCLDGQLCDYGTRDNRPGAATVTKWVAGSGL